MYAPVANWIDP